MKSLLITSLILASTVVSAREESWTFNPPKIETPDSSIAMVVYDGPDESLHMTDAQVRRADAYNTRMWDRYSPIQRIKIRYKR
jgi:hypothetical protein